MKALIALSIAAAAISTPAWSKDVTPNSKGEYCQMVKEFKPFQERLASLDEDPNYSGGWWTTVKSRISFQNPAEGMWGFNTGLCWWHSRLQRSLNYMTIINPTGPEMTEQEVEQAVSDLIDMDTVVTLNGYSSIYDFTKANKTIIHEKLKSWMAVESTVGFGWLNGTDGAMGISPETVKEHMMHAYMMVKKEGFVSYQMLQMDGVEAHSWLITKMDKLKEGNKTVGFTIHFVDSNFPLENGKTDYRFGDVIFRDLLINSYAGRPYGTFTPFNQHDDEVIKMKKAMYKYCKPSGRSLKNKDLKLRNWKKLF